MNWLIAGRRWMAGGARGRCAVAVTVGLVGALLATSAFAQSRATLATSAFVLPTAKHCVAGGALTIRVRKLHGVKWLAATVKVNGKRFKTIKRSQLSRPVKLTGLPAGRFVLSISARASNGRRASATRTYQACQGSGQPPAKSLIQPGSYSGTTTSQGLRPVTLYVSSDGTHVQDLSIPVVVVGCTPSGTSFFDRLAMGEVAIAADGSFSATTTAEGVLYGATAKFTYSFSGHFQGTTVAGAFREDITYNNGTTTTCTSNSQPWSGSRDTQGAPAKSPPPPGSYTGTTSQGLRAVTFSVSPDGTHLQNLSIPVVVVGCTPSGTSFFDRLAMGEVLIAADGSFSATTTAVGVLYGAAAKFTYSFSGHFHGYDSRGRVTVAGVFREDITYNNGKATTCTSNPQTWLAYH